MSKLDKSYNNNPPKFDVDVVDGFYLLSCMLEPPTKYGQFATAVMKLICDSDASEIHLMFEKDRSPSPRDVHVKKIKELYESTEMNFKIKGPHQERNSTLKKCLTSSCFREELVLFFIIIGRKTKQKFRMVCEYF